MTPNGMLAALRAAGVSADVWQMGGNCGVIGVVLPGGGYVTVVPESGPWSYGDDEGAGMGDVWGAYCYADDETEEWTDVAGLAFGDAVVPAASVVAYISNIV